MLRHSSESLESNLWCLFNLNFNTGILNSFMHIINRRHSDRLIMDTIYCIWVVSRVISLKDKISIKQDDVNKQNVLSHHKFAFAFSLVLCLVMLLITSFIHNKLLVPQIINCDIVIKILPESRPDCCFFPHVYPKSLLDEPNPNSPANSQAAQLYQENKREYEKRVSAIVEQSWRDCWPLWSLTKYEWCPAWNQKKPEQERKKTSQKQVNTASESCSVNLSVP